MARQFGTLPQLSGELDADDETLLRRDGKDYRGTVQQLAEKTAVLIGELAGTLASQAEAESGANVGKYMNPLRTQQAIAAFDTGGGLGISDHFAAAEETLAQNTADIATHTVEISAVEASLAAVIATSNTIYATTAAGVNTAVTGSANRVGGAGGTNGTFALVIPAPGPTGVQAVGNFTVAGGIVTAIAITTPGSNYASGNIALTNAAFVASAGLAGASATLTVGGGVAFGRGFSIPSASGDGYLDLYLNTAGTAVLQDTLPNLNLVDEHTVQIAAIEAQLNETPLAIDFTATSTYAQICTAGQVSPTNWTEAPSGSDLLITAVTGPVVRVIGFLTPDNDPRNKLYRVESTLEDLEAGLRSAIGLCINPSSATVIDATNHVFICWRASSGLVFAARQNGSTLAAGVLFNGTTSRLIQTYAAGEAVEMKLLYGDDPSTATLLCCRAGLIVATFEVTGLPTGYMGAACTMVVATDTARINEYDVTPKAQIERSWYVDAGASPGGTGSQAAPFQTLAEVSTALAENPGGAVNILLKGDYEYDGALVLLTKSYRKIRVAGSRGKKATIKASITRTSGWTNVGGATPNVWYRTHQFAGIVGTTATSSGVFDRTVGHEETFTHPYTGQSYEFPRPYRYMTPGQTAAAVQANGAACFMVNVADGRLYIRPYNDVDPNTLTLEVAEYANCINVQYLADADDAYCEFEIENVVCRFAYSSNISVNRAHIYASDTESSLSVLAAGWSLNDADGELHNCEAYRNRGDGFAGTDPGADVGAPVTSSRIAYIGLFDCTSMFQRLGDDQTGGAGGDGASLHSRQVLNVHGGEFSYNGKDGIVCGNYNAYNVICRGNFDAQFACGSFSADYPNARAQLFNPVIDGTDLGSVKRLGVYLVNGGGGDDCVIDVYGGVGFNTSTLLKTVSALAPASRGTINTYNLLDGTGNDALKNTAGGGVITCKNNAVVT